VDIIYFYPNIGATYWAVTELAEVLQGLLLTTKAGIVLFAGETVIDACVSLG